MINLFLSLFLFLGFPNWAICEDSSPSAESQKTDAPSESSGGSVNDGAASSSASGIADKDLLSSAVSDKKNNSAIDSLSPEAKKKLEALAATMMKTSTGEGGPEQRVKNARMQRKNMMGLRRAIFKEKLLQKQKRELCVYTGGENCDGSAPETAEPQTLDSMGEVPAKESSADASGDAKPTGTK